jgi:hypothetical protein
MPFGFELFDNLAHAAVLLFGQALGLPHDIGVALEHAVAAAALANLSFLPIAGAFPFGDQIGLLELGYGADVGVSSRK